MYKKKTGTQKKYPIKQIFKCTLTNNMLLNNTSSITCKCLSHTHTCNKRKPSHYQYSFIGIHRRRI